jgi:gas vesicle protein
MRTYGFIKGMAAGLVLGACATMMWDPVSDRQRHRIQRKTEGVFRSIGNIIDNAIDMIR